MKDFNLKWEIKNEYPIIYMDGDITSGSNVELFNAYEDICKSIKNSNIVLFDFNNVNYINSSGISSIIKLLQKQKNKNGDFIFIGLSEHFRKVMDIVGLADFITIHETFEDFEESL